LPKTFQKLLNLSNGIRVAGSPFQKGENTMKAAERHLAKPSFWQLVFWQSKVNGATYHRRTAAPPELELA
jgi:hypothetical protein